MRHDGPVPSAESSERAKAGERARIRAQRNARPEADRRKAANSIRDHARALIPAGGAIACYLSMPTEPGTGPLIQAAHRAGCTVAVPRIAGRDLLWVDLRPDSPLTPGPLGIREPVGEPLDGAHLAATDVMFIPGLAVDRTGLRLGQGGGYYDRTLHAVPAHADGGPLRVAVLFDEEILDIVPAEPHDRRVDAALTPSGIHPL